MKIFDGRDLSAYEDEAREQLTELYGAENINDYNVYDMAARWAADDLRIELDAIGRHFDAIGGRVLAAGTVGTWRGALDGGNVYEDFSKAFSDIFSGCDYFTITDERGRLTISGAHHDGRNTVEFLALTDRGAELLDKWNYDFSDTRTEADIHGIIYGSNLFSKIPHFSRDYYGAKE